MNLVMDWAYSGLPTEPQSLSIRLFRSVFDNVRLEHGVLPCVLPLAVSP